MKNFLLIFLIILPQFLFAQAGSLDSTFGVNGTVPLISGATNLVVQPDGKILIATQGFGGSDIERFNSDGSHDSTFSDDGIIEILLSPGGVLVLQPDGKINFGSGATILRYNSAGIPDSSFGDDGQVFVSLTSPIRKLLLQPDGKMVAYLYPLVIGSMPLLGRINADGAVDSSFGINGIVQAYFPVSYGDAALLSNGKFLVACSGFPILLLKFNQDGSVDSSFGIDGRVSYDKMTGFYLPNGFIAEQSDGKILLAGTAFDGIESDFAVARFEADGSVDSSFGTNGLAVTETEFSSNPDAWESPSTIALQADGKIVVAGTDYNAGVGAYAAVVRYLPNGVPDSSFSADGVTHLVNGTYWYHLIRCMAILPDGKILAAGTTAMFRIFSGLHVGIDETSSEKNFFEAYPNPASNQLNLQFLNPTSCLLSIINVIGERMLEQKVTNVTSLQLDVKRFPPGVYFLSITDENKNVVTEKFIKM